MTNIEWKELCEWAKSIDDNALITDSYVEIGNLYYYKDGIIYSEGIIARNRSPEKIKSIIENLL